MSYHCYKIKRLASQTQISESKEPRNKIYLILLFLARMFYCTRSKSFIHYLNVDGSGVENSALTVFYFTLLKTELIFL